jgi:predicted ATPase
VNGFAIRISPRCTNSFSLTARADYPQAITYAVQLLASDPLREDTVRQLIALRYAVGDRAGALQEYERFVRRLSAELDVEPMPETIALYEAVVRNTRLPGAAPTIEITPPSEKVAPLTLPFVGREADMAHLRVAWSRAAQGHGDIVLIGGEAGIGKTRLAAELAQFVETQGARVLWGSTAFTEPMPYQAVVEALSSVLPLLAALEINPIWLSAVVPLLPALATRRGNLAKPSPLDSERERARLFEALVQCIEGLAQPRPLLLILEDLHWAGAATIAWLEFFARRVSQHRLLVLLTYRDEEIARAHPWREVRRRLQTEHHIAHCALSRLTASDVETLVAQCEAGGSPAAGRLPAPQLFAASGGNPLFLTELIRDLNEAGQMATAHGDAIPQEVQATIAGRVTRLSDNARFLAEIAAVIGTAFNIELVREACGWDEAQVLDAVDELLDHHLIHEVGGRGRFDYTFTHSLHQAAIYVGVPEPVRRRRHRRVARVMEELYAERLDDLASQLALHLDRAGEARRAAEYYLRVVRRAQSVHADEEALTHIAHALELDPDLRTRFNLLLLRETIHSRRGERDAQRTDLQQLEQLAPMLNDDDTACEVLRRLIFFLRALGERQEEAAAIDALKTRAFAHDAKRWQAEALQAEAAHQVLIGQYDAAQDSLERALALHRELDDANNQVQCFCLLAEVASHRGEWARVQPLLDQATALAESRGNYALLIQTWRTASGVLFARQDFTASARLAQQMLERCCAIGDREGKADAHARLGAIAARQFQIQSAREHYDRARALYAALEKRQGLAAVLINRAVLASRLGHYAESLDAYAQAETLFQSLNDLRGQVVSALNTSIVNLFQGDYAAAKSAAQRGMEIARAMHAAVMEANALANLGAAERELGELPDAIAHMCAGLAIRRQLDQPAELGTDLCDLTIAYLRAGDLESARASADEMLALHASAAETMMHPQYILWAAAQTHRALGDTERARTLLAQAHQVFEEKAAAIPDPESRATFAQLPFNRELLDAYAAG